VKARRFTLKMSHFTPFAAKNRESTPSHLKMSHFTAFAAKNRERTPFHIENDPP